MPAQMTNYPKPGNMASSIVTAKHCPTTGTLPAPPTAEQFWARTSDDIVHFEIDLDGSSICI